MRCNVRIIAAALIILLTVFVVSCGADTDDYEHTWRVGFGEMEIYVDLSDRSAGEYYIAGYRTDNLAEGILDYQTVRALWLDDGGGGVMIITVDCVGLSSADIKEIKSAVKSELSALTCRDIFVISTHDHAGIDTLGMWGEIGISGKNGKFGESLIQSAVDAVKLAVADIHPAYDIALYEHPLPKLRDSRPPEYIDYNLHVLNIDGIENGIMLYNAGVHAESLGGSNSLVSADFPGKIAKRQSELYGNRFMFVPGAVGGLITTHNLSDDPVENMRLTAEMIDNIGMSAVNYSERIELEPRIELVSQEIVVPLDNPVFAVLSTLGVMNSETVPCDSDTGLGISTHVSILRLGGTVDIMMIPGELTPELAYSLDENTVALESLIPDGNKLLIFGLCDDEIGYILPEDGFLLDENLPYLTEYEDDTGENHYEETNSAGPRTFGVIYDTISKLEDKLNY